MSALQFEVVARWGPRARASRLYLPHAGLGDERPLSSSSSRSGSSSSSSSSSEFESASGSGSVLPRSHTRITGDVSACVQTPVFMPVGTQGTLKGMLHAERLCGPKSALGPGNDCRLILGNTYHLGHRPGAPVLDAAGGLHRFMHWPHALLTDSGGFQMVSLLRLAHITEDGVNFRSPHDGSEMMLTPEQSMGIQNSIGADIMMALDDVVHSSTTGDRVEEAMERTLRWLDRCIGAHKRPHEQNLFAIVQGGLDAGLRDRCLDGMLQPSRDDFIPGYAIGGLSGGESKDSFWRVVHQCTARLPENKPRYLMGVGYALDLVVCSSLGVDMFDCVFPSRTARFGTALVPEGNMHLKHVRFARDYRPIDDRCGCSTCVRYTRSYLHHIARSDEMQSGELLTVHNIAYQMRLMRELRASIQDDRLDAFVQDFMRTMFARQRQEKPSTAAQGAEASQVTAEQEAAAERSAEPMIDKLEPIHPSGYPKWAVEALAAAEIELS